jgi:hypothetical protein
MTKVTATEITKTKPDVEVGQYWLNTENGYIYLVISGMAGEYLEEVEVFSLVDVQNGRCYGNIEGDILEIFGNDICIFVHLEKVEIVYTKQ